MVDPPLKQWIFSKPDVVAIEYHTSFPYAGDPFYLANPAEVTARVFYNEIFATPSIRMDGPSIPAANNPTAYEVLYQQRKAIPSRARIELGGSYDPGTRAGEVSARVIAESAMPGDQRLRIALIENDIPYPAPNGIDIHHHVFRRLVPDTTGTVLAFAAPYPDTVLVDLPFAVAGDWVEENVELVAFLQEQGSRQIEQGAGAAITDLTVAVGEEPAPPAASADRLDPVRPNPFNPRAEIRFELARGGQTEVDVYDALGRRVRTLLAAKRVAGAHSLLWDGRDDAGQDVGSGIYFVRLSGPTATRVERAVLLR